MLTGGVPSQYNEQTGGLVTASVNRNFYHQHWHQSIQGMRLKGSRGLNDTLKVDAGLSRQKNMEYYPFDRGYLSTPTAVPGGVFQLNILDEYSYMTPTNAAAQAVYSGAFSRINTFDHAIQRYDREFETVGQVNVTKKFPLGGDTTFDVKGGFYGRFRDKDMDRHRSTLTQVATSNFTFADLRGGTEMNLVGKGIPFGDFGNNATIWNLINTQAAVFPTTSTAEFTGFGPGNYISSEDIYAYYLQGTYKVGQLTAIAGARYEMTDQQLFRLANDNVTPISVDDDFAHTMPSIHVRYDFTPQIIGRVSWTNTVGRHDTGDLIYGPVAINRTARTITVPNPGLKPLEYGEHRRVRRLVLGSARADLGRLLHEGHQEFPAADRFADHLRRPAVHAKHRDGGCERGDPRLRAKTFKRRLDFLSGWMAGSGLDTNYTSSTRRLATDR